MIAAEANGLIDGGQIAEALAVNVLEPSAAERIARHYEKADLIIDASTSLAVEHYLARDVASPARRISIFLNPAGTDSVLLAEDSGRRVTLDCLEMQYYRAITNVPVLDRHLETQTGAIRFARSCRDVSSTIPQDSLALHSAACTRGIRNAIAADDPRILIWRAGADFSIETYSVPVCEVVQQQIGAWTIWTDAWFLQRVQQAREDKLPNETGGVLIGAFDMQRQIVYVVDTIPSPADSSEWPTAYIRGSEGLLQRIEQIQGITAGNLEYVGEWHSHPFGCPASLSEDDVKALAWLQEMMSNQGLPAVMLIIGNSGERSWNLAEPLQ
jgi:proteasome lid subunit RPN8/RPN11